MNRGNGSGVWTAPAAPANPSNVGMARINSNSGISSSNNNTTNNITNNNTNVQLTGQSVSGPLRRACPASGAQWNVQVVKGKMTGRCLWNACKALSLGLLLMVLGTAMATIGYYADRLSSAQVVRGNHTVKVKNETRGFHLNNLSYAGPIVMGVGGFIVVAACVMTFEARDSAAKVVPARLKAMGSTGGTCLSYHRGLGTVGGSSRRSAVSQTQNAATNTGTTTVQQQPINEWDQQLGVFKSSPTDRRALTAALQQFSRELGTTCGIKHSPKQSSNHLSPILKTQLNRSPSAPLLCPGMPPSIISEGVASPSASASPRPSLHPFSRYHYSSNIAHGSKGVVSTRPGAYSLLSPAGLLKRHAVSVDESGPYSSDIHKNSRESLHGSQTSMAMDLHYPNDQPVTLRVKDTARRRMLTRQKPVEAVEEPMESPISTILQSIPSQSSTTSQQQHPRVHMSRRRSSNASDHMHHARKRRRDTSRPFLERAASTDARVMTHEMYHPNPSYNHRVTCSQELPLHSKHRSSCCTGLSSIVNERRKHTQSHCKTHRNSCEFRKQRSYSPKGGASIESKDNGSGNRSN